MNNQFIPIKGLIYGIFLILEACAITKKTHIPTTYDNILYAHDTVRINVTHNSCDTVFVHLDWEKAKTIKSINYFVQNKTNGDLLFNKIIHFKEDFISSYPTYSIKSGKTVLFTANCSILNPQNRLTKRQIALEGILDKKAFKIIILFNIYLP